MGRQTPRLIKIAQQIYSFPPLLSAYTRLSWRCHSTRVRRRHGHLRLHIGAGNHIVAGWLNIDLHPGLSLLSMKVPEGLGRFADRSARCIYTSHLLEHLSYPTEAAELLRQCHRLLVPDGGLRIVVPDIGRIIRAYVDHDEPFFRQQARMHPAWCRTRLDHLLYALQQEGEHRYGYDAETLTRLLADTGFRTIGPSGFNGSRVPELNIDYHDDIDHTGASLHLFMDAIK